MLFRFWWQLVSYSAFLWAPLQKWFGCSKSFYWVCNLQIERWCSYHPFYFGSCTVAQVLWQLQYIWGGYCHYKEATWSHFSLILQLRIVTKNVNCYCTRYIKKGIKGHKVTRTNLILSKTNILYQKMLTHFSFIAPCIHALIPYIPLNYYSVIYSYPTLIEYFLFYW